MPMLALSGLLYSCEGEDEKLSSTEKEEETGMMATVTGLSVEPTNNECELRVKWINSRDKNTQTVELFYKKKEATEVRDNNDNPILVEVVRDTESNYLLRVPEYAEYEISAVAINKEGKRSIAQSTSGTPRVPMQPIPPLIERADLLMSFLLSDFFGKSKRDCWNTSFPNATGPYWNGDAVVWGQGSGLSGFVAIREASTGIEAYESKYAGLSDRMFNSINQFITNDNGKQAYAVYPAKGNERLYDDNVWIGLEMTDLYTQTNEQRFLDKAVMVWNYLMTGYDKTCGGGIHWREYPLDKASRTKHTCSTAPTAVMACKLYQITKEEKYKEKAIELYQWLKETLQDPNDYLYWDNINPELKIEKAKYTYNSGQPMQAACLLYQITNDAKYLEDAQNIAQAAYEKWFIHFYSYAMNETFKILVPEHLWFQAVMLRGFIELYKIDKNRTYVTAFEKSLASAWLSDCRNKDTNLLNNDFRGGKPQTKWEILHEGACVEMLARLASLERDEAKIEKLK